MESLDGLLSTAGFPPRWSCGVWSSTLGWTHILSDIAIFSAYFAIPAVILYYMHKRRDVPFPRIAWLFAVFIAACGTGHLVEAVIFWHPLYRLDALIKVTTALTSWLTVAALVQVVPIALTFPGLKNLNAQLSKANSELAETNRELDAFAAVASHDLKAPLRGIRALVEWVKKDASNLNDKQAEHLRQIDERIERMQDLIDGILHYSRFSRQAPTLAHVQTGDITRTIAKALHIPEGIEVQVIDPMPTIRFDPIMFEQIVQNLISNALMSFDTPRGKITISASREAGYHVFHVADTGRGIPKEDLEGIFKMFHTAEVHGGTGVGLSIVKRIAERFGGDVTVESALQSGSTFHVRLPA